MRHALTPLALFCSLALAGCPASTTLEDFDGAVITPDTGIVSDGGGARDAGTTALPDGAIVPNDGGVTPPPSDGGVTPPPDDGGVTPPPSDGGGPPPPPSDGGIVPPPFDGGTPPPADGGPSPGTDAGPGSIVCGASTCTPGQICCATFTGGMVVQMCQTGTTCMGGATLTCDGPEDCTGGQVCCGMRTAGGGGTACVDSAMCMFGRLCHATSDCGGTDMCCPFMGLSVCSPRCF